MESSQRPSSHRSSSQEVDSQLIEEKIVKPNGDIAIKSYNKGRFLGKGGFARVYEFTCLDNKHVSAAKVIPKAALSKARAKQKLMSEIKIHRALHQTNIVGFEHFFEDQENVYILLELCTNQTLNELLRPSQPSHHSQRHKARKPVHIRENGAEIGRLRLGD